MNKDVWVDKDLVVKIVPGRRPTSMIVTPMGAVLPHEGNV